MRKEKIRIAILVTLLSNLASAQMYWRDLAPAQVKKPDVATLNSLPVSGENVNLSIGLITPVVSVTNIATNSLSSDINLNYIKGNGVKVNDIASDLGLGWELSAGGSITRKINGFPDESKIFPNVAVGEWGTIPTAGLNGQKTPNGWLDFANWNSKVYNTPYNGTAVLPGQPFNDQSLGGAIQAFAENVQNNIYPTKFRSLLAQVVHGPANLGSGLTIADLAAMAGMGWDLLDVDGEPDIFYFNFGNYSGKFVFDGNKIPTTIPYIPGLKIESPFDSVGNQWVFTTPEGIKYFFSNNAEYTEKTYSETQTAPLYDDCFGVTPNKNEGIDVNEYTSKWHLTKVEGINGDFINYSYASAPDLIYTENSGIKQVFRPGNPSLGYTSSPPSYFIDSGDPGFNQRELSRNTTSRIKSPKRLSTITTSDNNKIMFKYDGIEREDIDQSQNGSNKRRSLSSIEKYDYNNTLIEKYKLNQSYFTGSCTTYECKRLKLNAITQVMSLDGSNDASTGFEYNISENLPQRNFYQQDFWGYYNNNHVNTIFPTVLDISFYDGGYKGPTESRAQANILTKITFPTKGTIEYAYESNDFKTGLVNGVSEQRSTAGVRIKSITKKVSSSDPNPKIVSYIYKLDNGQSSGVMPQHLSETLSNDTYGAGKIYDTQTVEVDENDGTRSRYNMIYSNPKYTKLEEPLHYSKVTVKTLGKGQTEYTLSAGEGSYNINDKMISRRWIAANPSTGNYIANSTYITNLDPYNWPYNIENNSPTIELTVSANKGLIMSERTKDESGNILSEVVNTYERNPPGFNMKTVYGIGVASPDVFLGEQTRINTVDFHINKYYSEYFFLKTRTKNEYFNGKIVNTVQNYSFNPECFVSQENTQYPNNDVKEEKYLYASDKQVQKLINANIVGEPLEQQTKKNSEIIKRVEKKYEIANSLLPSSVSTYLLDNSSESFKNITIDRYDLKGNQLQFTSQGNTPTTILWGYKGTLPIAMIEGATYGQVMQAFGLNENDNSSYLQLEVVKKSDLDVNESSENDLINELKNLRNHDGLKNYRITTYAYDPLIGAKTIITPSGVKQIYKYDLGNRLEKVLDADGKIVREFKYNYKPTIHYNSSKSGIFTRNNCDPGMISSPYTYTVPANQYISYISKDDADQKAQNDVNTNGQNAANANTICYYPYCEFNAQASSQYIMMQYAPFQKANTTVNAELHFMVTSNQGLNWSGGVQLGNIPSPCWPTSTVTRTSGNWQVTIYQASGQTVLRWLGSGNPATGTSYNVSFNYNVF